MVLAYVVTIGQLEAAVPAEKCPDNYVAVTKNSIVLADVSCPSRYAGVGSVLSCLAENPDGTCMMYAPVGVTYTDSVGAYEYTSACLFTGVPTDGDVTWTGDEEEDDGGEEESSSSSSQQ